MSELGRRLVRGRKPDRPQEDGLSPEAAQALHTLRREAKSRGATLASGGKGGLPPPFVLSIFRRDDYHCKRCGGDQDLTLHHKGGIVASEWLSKQGHKTQAANVSVLCDACHDAIHQEARKKGIDSSQVQPIGDKHGKGKG